MLKQKMLRRKRFCMTRSFSPLDVGDHNQSAFDKADLSSSKAKMQFEHDLEANLRSFEKELHQQRLENLRHLADKLKEDSWRYPEVESSLGLQ